jgi:hypothetical protein
MIQKQTEVIGQCRCCRETKRLRLSHIISSLAYRRLKRFPGQNRLVEGEAEVVQDGPKRHLLCEDCEQLLGDSERLFNDRFLNPYYKAKRFRAEYGDWLARFAAANLWRILITLLEDNEIPAVLLKPATEAERVWCAFIRRDAPDYTPYNLHLVLIDNRPEWAAYAEGAVEYGIPANRFGTEAYLVAKLPGLAMIGVFCEQDDRHWQQTKINPSGGLIDAMVNCRWPALIGRYFQRQIKAASQVTRVEWEL